MLSSTSDALLKGFQYVPNWISKAEEQLLLEGIAALSFAEVRMHGVVAKRRVVHFGWDYGYESWRVTPTKPIPEWLMAVRAQAARLVGLEAAALEEVLVSRYEPGAGIGWHRDAPMFGPVVVGVSLLGACRMRFQQKTGVRRELAERTLEPRSVYVLSEAARWSWQHAILPTRTLRYSITFRTVENSRTSR
jgi:DNA oxidative demethylase